MRLRNALPLAAAVAILVAAFALVALTGECGAMASCPATARVNDRTYLVAIARGLTVEPADLVRYATVARRTGGQATLDEDAYQLGRVDPARVLVMKLAPGQADAAGGLGDYLLLVSDGSAWPLTCPFFPAIDPLRPTICD